MRVVNNDAKFYLSKTPEMYLQDAAKAKKKIYLEAFLQKHRHLSTLVASVDGLLGVEEEANLKRIARRLAKNCQQPYLSACGYVNSRSATTLVRATHRCIQLSRVPAQCISVQRLQWDDGVGLNLFQ